MSIQFQDVSVSINATGIQASSASISVTSNLSENRVVGNAGVISQSPSGPITCSLDIEYYVKTDLDPIYLTASGIKSYVSTSPVAVNIGGLRGPAYLTSYSVKASPNSLAQASASFTIFGSLNGYLHPKYYELNYTGTNLTGQAHGWTTEISTTDSSNILSFGYSFSAKWQPIYSIGGPNVTSVVFHGGIETFDLSKETYTAPSFSGVDSSNLLSASTITLNSLNSICSATPTSITFDAANSKIVSSNVSVQTQDVVRTSVNLVKYF